MNSDATGSYRTVAYASSSGRVAERPRLNVTLKKRLNEPLDFLASYLTPSEGVKLTWRQAREQYGDLVEIQRSRNDGSWEHVDKVQTNSGSQYLSTYYDVGAKRGAYYRYRIRYSDAEAVSLWAGGQAASVWTHIPTPGLTVHTTNDVPVSLQLSPSHLPNEPGHGRLLEYLHRDESQWLVLGDYAPGAGSISVPASVAAVAAAFRVVDYSPRTASVPRVKSIDPRLGASYPFGIEDDGMYGPSDAYQVTAHPISAQIISGTLDHWYAPTSLRPDANAAVATIDAGGVYLTATSVQDAVIDLQFAPGELVNTDGYDLLLAMNHFLDADVFLSFDGGAPVRFDYNAGGKEHHLDFLSTPAHPWSLYNAHWSQTSTTNAPTPPAGFLLGVDLSRLGVAAGESIENLRISNIWGFDFFGAAALTSYPGAYFPVLTRANDGYEPPFTTGFAPVAEADVDDILELDFRVHRRQHLHDGVNNLDDAGQAGPGEYAFQLEYPGSIRVYATSPDGPGAQIVASGVWYERDDLTYFPGGELHDALYVTALSSADEIQATIDVSVRAADWAPAHTERHAQLVSDAAPGRTSLDVRFRASDLVRNDVNNDGVIDAADESAPASAAAVGQVLLVADFDSDFDGLIDWADGFDSVIGSGLDFFSSASPFAELPLYIPAYADIENYWLEIDYEAVDPQQQEPFGEPIGALRIWTNVAHDFRDERPTSQGGEYLAPGLYRVGELGLAPGEHTLYVEAIDSARNIGDSVVHITLAEQASPAHDQLIIRDEVRYTAVKMELIGRLPGSATDVRLTRPIGLSLPRPGNPATHEPAGSGGPPLLQRLRIEDPRSGFTSATIAGHTVPLGRFSDPAGDYYLSGPLAFLTQEEAAVLAADLPVPELGGLRPSDVVGSAQVIVVNDPLIGVSYNPSFAKLLKEFSSEVAAQHYISQTVIEVTEELVSINWMPDPPGSGSQIDPDAFGKEVDRRVRARVIAEFDAVVGSANVETFATSAIVSLDSEDFGTILGFQSEGIPAPDKAYMEIDVVYAKPGHELKVGAVISSENAIAFEVKTSANGRVSAKQVDKYNQVFDASEPARIVTSPKRMGIRRENGVKTLYYIDNDAVIRKMRVLQYLAPIIAIPAAVEAMGSEDLIERRVNAIFDAADRVGHRKLEDQALTKIEVLQAVTSFINDASLGQGDVVLTLQKQTLILEIIQKVYDEDPARID